MILRVFSNRDDSVKISVGYAQFILQHEQANSIPNIQNIFVWFTQIALEGYYPRQLYFYMETADIMLCEDSLILYNMY